MGIEYGLNTLTGIPVYVDGKRTGDIRSERGVWRYWPKGQNFGGELFPNLRACKESLESE